ncbi:malonyl-[acyl-carrier protein] O-methyltransferase BioC [Bacillus sp. FJAT-27264]|uniref:malonyl-ACP O-methyltransferase BioC n=1 Tax=Paenibacillus sp. (strain DSM 101736 / FJAT-27264) TaxID=1850362 RepID=UPI000807E384|nr:malonyl-ACP O-methyltransferase BioC [Bacillus sp. FJAT-27264]OBZ19400.1 malonyl-[acyl-carrier protein] O-methyltransferase BioC [Bacillus sp. FJAT-27264]
MSSRISDVRRQFNRNANSYDAHAHIQRLMSDRLAQSFLGLKSKSNFSGLNILEIGCGTGNLTETLVTEWPSASITALDIAPAMIKLAEQRVLSAETNFNSIRKKSSDSLRFLHADVETWAPDAKAASFDLIVSNACFQWLSNPGQTLGHLRRMLRPGGSLTFTTFGPDTFCEMHEAFNEVYRANGMEPQRHGLRFLSTDEWSSLLKEAGFSSIQFERSIQTETYASARDFLHSVKAMGASTSEAITVSGLSSRSLFTSMYKEYEAKFSIPEGVAASYDILLFQALAEE